MAEKGITDDQIIAAFNELQSTQKVAQRLGCSPRNLQRRRLKIVVKRGIVLPVKDARPRYNTAAIDHSSAVARYRISDGSILIGSDAHIWPGERTTMQRAFLYLARKLQPDAIVINGDFFDGSRLSRFASIGWEKRPDVWAELEAVGDYLKDLEAAAPKAKRFWPAGNHDLRFESKLANIAPQYENVSGMHLKDHLPNWLPCWRLDVNDDIIIRHRELGGEHADFRNVQTSGKTIFTGHDHRIGIVFWNNYTGLHYGVRSGFMCDSPLDPQFRDYLEAREPNWWPGCVVATFREGKLLMPELCIRHGEGEVQWRGEIISV